MSTETDTGLVGPVVRAGELAEIVGEAAEIDNPGVPITVDDQGAYVRVGAPGEMILRASTIEELLGRPFKIRELEVNLASFAGQIDFGTEQVRFYFQSNEGGNQR